MRKTPVLTLPHAAESNLPARFEELALLFQYRPALVSDTRHMDYGQLNAVANKLAHTLQKAQLLPGERVALLMRHDVPLIAGMLSILKAGMVVVTLNPSDPQARLLEIMEDAAAAVILTDKEHFALADSIVDSKQSVLLYEDHMDVSPDNNPGTPIAPCAAAFLIYTSGTTGRPKGVIQTHRNVLHNALRLALGMRIGSQDRLILLGSLSGGQGVSTTWSALLNGATLCPFPVKQKGVACLADWMRERGISVYVSTASLFRYFMKTLGETERLTGVRLVRLASESATRGDFLQFQRHFSADCVLLNSLSSSETGNITQLLLSAGDVVSAGKLPVGNAAEGIEILLLGHDGEYMPSGNIGEIVVKSRYLSPGYWRNETLTALRFQNVNEEGHSVRLFRSGDLGRFDPQGRLEYLGRRDHQVKIRGYRIELFEIEEALLRMEEVNGAVVGVHAGDDVGDRLIAYIVPQSGYVLTSEFLRIALRRILPEYMVPTNFMVMDEFPLNAHGKIDRGALSRINPRVRDAGIDTDVSPRHGVEAILGRIWSEAFGRVPVGRHDNFFDLGGESLIAMLIVAKVHAELNVEVHLQLFAEYPTLVGMAGAVEEKLRLESAFAVGEIRRVDRETPLPLSFVQERVWRESQTDYGSAGYTMAANYSLHGLLDREILRECMNYVASRHEILRTTFPIIDGQPCQKIHPPLEVELSYLDFSHFPDPKHKALELFKQHSGMVFDLEVGPLVVFWLIRIGANEHYLLRIDHHIISDGLSWSIYFSELGCLYAARKRGEPPPLPDYEPLQYADFAVWQRNQLSAGEHSYKSCLDWWRERLTGSPESFSLPFIRVQPADNASPDSGFKGWYLAPKTTRRLDELGRRENATYFVARLAVFVALLAAETQQKDLVIGTYVTNRNRSACQQMFGFFGDLVILRFFYDENMSMRTWLGKVRDNWVEAEKHTEIPYQTLSDELRSQGLIPPEITALFTTSSYFEPVCFADMKLSLIKRRRNRMPWGFTLALDLQNQEIPFETRFDAGIYDTEKVEHFMRQYLRLLELASRFPQQSLASLITLTRFSVKYDSLWNYISRPFRKIWFLLVRN